MPKPVIAIVGRPNVGKSTIFNRIVGERVSIVEDIPGVTRDRIYSAGEWLNHEFNIIDNIIYTESNNILLLSLDGDVIKSIDFDEDLKQLSKNNVLFVDNDMYFISGHLKGYGIAKIDIDSLQYSQITYDQCSNFNIQDDWIYFVKEKDSNLYKIKTDGTLEQKLSNIKVARNGINIIDDWVYFYNIDDKLYRINTNGTVHEKVW